MKKYVLVETMASYRMRYVVELNADDPNEWACDTVVSDEAGEIGQKFLGENISDFREVAPEEVRYLAIQDCKAYRNWSAEEVLTRLVRQEGVRRYGDEEND